MARCTHPHYALDLGINPDTGKARIKFMPGRYDLSSKQQLEFRYGKDAVLTLPCGQCLNCRINHSKEWAVRCVLESLEHENNWFITLTYDDDHLPRDGALHREHLREFFKALYNRGYHFRYFGCGEYGSLNNRPHYHLILFGLDLDDMKYIQNAKSFSSKTLDACWPYGFYFIGDVSYSSCNYVAQYTLKKNFKDSLKYPVPEFICYSNRPGLAYSWCEKHLDTLLKYDAVYGDFGNSKVSRLPRYFEKVADSLDHQLLEAMKQKRLKASDAATINEMIKHNFDVVEQLYKYSETVSINKFKQQRMRKL